jgi:hypothetical protein
VGGERRGARCWWLCDDFVWDRFGKYVDRHREKDSRPSKNFNIDF